MRPSSCKAKGRRFQQQIAADILAAFPNLGEDDVRSTSMGASGEDIQLSTSARTLFPYSVEAKNQEKLNIWNAIEQCEKNAGESIPIVVFKKNNTIPYVTMPWKHFIARSCTHLDISKKQQLVQAIQIMQNIVHTMKDED